MGRVDIRLKEREERLINAKKIDFCREMQFNFHNIILNKIPFSVEPIHFLIRIA